MNEIWIILTVRLPRSGKSTWAKKQGFPIVNPDSIRLALHGKRFIPESEDFVWAITYVMIRSLILAGHQRVIVDATHTTEKRRKPYFNKFLDCVIKTKVFDTSKKECIERAKKINDEEIIPVIERMANQFEECESDF